MKIAIEEFLIEHVWYLFFGFLIALGILIFWIWRRKHKKSRYNNWKEERINLGFYVLVFARNEDPFLEELFTENELLEAKIKLLRKEKSKTEFALVIISVSLLFQFLPRVLERSNKKKGDEQDKDSKRINIEVSTVESGNG